MKEWPGIYIHVVSLFTHVLEIVNIYISVNELNHMAMNTAEAVFEYKRF